MGLHCLSIHSSYASGLSRFKDRAESYCKLATTKHGFLCPWQVQYLLRRHNLTVDCPILRGHGFRLHIESRNLSCDGWMDCISRMASLREALQQSGGSMLFAAMVSVQRHRLHLEIRFRGAKGDVY
jgi:hypothetical protein